MPAGDRSGPMGLGPMTGWSMGYCGGYDAPGRAYWGPVRGFSGRGGRGMRGGWWGGFGPGLGGSWRWRHWVHATGQPRWTRQGPVPAWGPGVPYAPLSREQEIEMLKDEADWLKEQLDVIDQRMDELSQE